MIEMQRCLIVVVTGTLVAAGLYMYFADSYGMFYKHHLPLAKLTDEGPIPPIDLTIRMPVDKGMTSRLLCWLLRSAVLFWKKEYGDIVLILDEEDRKKDFSQKLNTLNVSFNFRYVYEKKPSKNDRFIQASHRVGRSIGYTRQLYSSFFIDLYARPKSIVAWIDTDVSFTMPVIDRSIYNNGRLIVKGIDTFYFSWVRDWDRTTKIALGVPLVADFMSYFPVYVYPETIKNCRQHILKHLNVTNMEDAFDKIAVVFLSPVNIIVNYAYFFERDLYEWHIDIGGHTIDTYNKAHLPVKDYLLPSDILPELHVTVHTRYYKSKVDPLEQAICYTHIHLGRTNLSHCQVFNGKPNLQLFEFQTQATHIKSWCGGTRSRTCASIIEDRYKMFTALYRNHEYPLDSYKIKIVEDLANNKFQIKCHNVISVPFS